MKLNHPHNLRNILKLGLKGVGWFCVIVATLIAGIAILAYRGTLTGSNVSPDGKFEVRYYKSLAIPLITMDIIGECKPFWLRLYNKNTGEKLSELYTDNCSMENDPTWAESVVIFPDKMHMYELPSGRELPL